MLTIGEFSKICQVSIKTLHYYDQIGLIKPAYVDPENNYRYYNIEQINILNKIKRLKRYRFSLEEIARLLILKDEQEIVNILLEQEKKIANQLFETQTILNEIQFDRDYFSSYTNISERNVYSVQLKKSTERNLILLREKMTLDSFSLHYQRLFNYANQKNIRLTGLIGAYYFDEDFHPEGSDIGLFAEVQNPSQANYIQKSLLCACCVHRGDYKKLFEAYGAITKWVEENHFVLNESPFEIYRTTKFHTYHAEDWETEIYYPVKPMASI